MIWELSYKADPRAREVADRHYNRQKPGTPQFVPPGRALVLYFIKNGAFDPKGRDADHGNNPGDSGPGDS